MTTPTTPRPAIEALDVPLAEVEAQTCRMPACELKHLFDAKDDTFAALAAEHPEACSCAADYPNWTPGGQQ